MLSPQKSGKRGKKIQELIDATLLKEIEKESLFEQLYGTLK